MYIDTPLNMGSRIKKQSENQSINTLRKRQEPSKMPINTVKLQLISSDWLTEYNELFSQTSVIAVDVKEVKNSIRYIILSSDSGVGLILDYQGLIQSDKTIDQIISNILSGKQLKLVRDGKQLLKVLSDNNISISGPLFDLWIAYSVLRAGLDKLSGFDDIVKKYYGSCQVAHINFNYTLSERDIEAIGKDLGIMFHLKERMEERLKQLNLVGTAKLEFDCLYSIFNLERIGVNFDVTKYKALISNLKLFQDGLGEQHSIIANTMLNQKSVSSLLQRYNEEFLSYIGKDNRIHPEYLQIESATGRIYCSNPNLQQFPRDKEFRACIVPAAGYKFIDADYSQIELRIAAEISNDKVMIKTFQEGQDIHLLTAAAILQKEHDNVTDEERRAAKAVNFGLVFGMSGEGLQRYAQKNYQISLAIEEAESFKKRFFETYKGIREWQEQCRQNRYRQVARTLSGRRRVWSETPSITEMLSTPVQGSEADILKLALVKLDDALKPYDAHVVLIVHDEIVVEAAEGQAVEVKGIVVRCMFEAGQAILKKVPVDVKAVIGDSWGNK